MDKLVLASASPRRRELLRVLDLPFEVVVSQVDEDYPFPLTPEDFVKELALRKAKAVAESLDRGLVIGADTIVVNGDQILGKPAGSSAAAEMLRDLSGREHKVYTGVALVDKATGKQSTAVEVTLVKFKALAELEIQAYIATGEPFDKAGAYAIQGRAAVFVESIKGDYFNVVGLPLFRLAQLLREFGVVVLGPKVT